MKKLSVRLSEFEHNELNEFVYKNKTSQNEVIKRALRKYYKNPDIYIPSLSEIQI